MTEEERVKCYRESLASGLSDYEAREDAWPIHDLEWQKEEEE